VVAAQVPVDAAEAVESPPLAPAVPDLPEGRQSLPVGVNGLVVAMQAGVDPAQAVEGPPLAPGHPGLPEERQSLLREVQGLVVAPHAGIDLAEAAEHPRFGPPVPGLSGSGQADLVDALPICPVLAKFEEEPQDVGELPGHLLQTNVGSLMDGSHEAGALRLHP